MRPCPSQGKELMKKIILRNSLSPGDIVMLTAAVRDLHLSHPGKFLTDVRTSCHELWENNPYITRLDEKAKDVVSIDCEYPLIHQSNTVPYHFIHAFRLFLSERLGLEIRPHTAHGDIHLTDQEKTWMSQIDEITGNYGTPFWIIGLHEQVVGSRSLSGGR
jgi:chorismate mutase